MCHHFTPTFHIIKELMHAVFFLIPTLTNTSLQRHYVISYAWSSPWIISRLTNSIIFKSMVLLWVLKWLLLFLTVLRCIRVGSTNVCPVTGARNLGSWFDEQLTMSTHISKLCGVAFYHLRNIKRIRKYLPRKSAEMLIHAFITSRVDYCNSLLYGLPNYQLNKLQRVLNT